MSRTRSFQFRHLREFIVSVFHPKGDGASQRLVDFHAGKNVDGIGFDLLTPAAAVPALTQTKQRVDFICINFQPGGKAVQQSQNAFSVRFSSC